MPLPLKKVVEPPKGIFSDEEILRKILDQVRVIKAKMVEKKVEAAQ